MKVPVYALPRFSTAWLTLAMVSDKSPSSVHVVSATPSQPPGALERTLHHVVLLCVVVVCCCALSSGEFEQQMHEQLARMDDKCAASFLSQHLLGCQVVVIRIISSVYE